MTPTTLLRAENAKSLVGSLGWRSHDGMTTEQAAEMSAWISDNNAVALEHAQQIAALSERDSPDELARKLYVRLVVVRRALPHQSSGAIRLGRLASDSRRAA